MVIFSISFNMTICWVFSLESPHRGDSNEYTHHTIINKNENHPKLYKKKRKNKNNVCSYGILLC